MKQIDKAGWLLMFAILVLSVLYVTTKAITHSPYDILDYIVLGFAWGPTMFLCYKVIKKSKATRNKIKEVYGHKP